ncbi:MAG TPA: YncE family protein [Opitutaceae bacterium]
MAPCRFRRSCVIAFAAVLLGGGSLPAAPVLLVGEKTGSALSIIDPEGGKVVGRVAISPNPHEVATDGTHAYISHPNRPAITVVDIAARKELAPIELGSLGPCHGLWYAAGKLFFANEGARTIGRYDLATGKIDWVMGMGFSSHMLMTSPDGQTVFVPGAPASLSLVEYKVNPVPPAPRRAIPWATTSAQAADPNRPRTPVANRGPAVPRPEWITTTLPAGAGIEGIDVSPDGKELWGINVQDRTITVVDIGAKAVKATIPLRRDFSNRIRFTPDGRHVFVSELNGSEVLVLDAVTHAEVKRIEVGGGHEGISMHPDGTRAYVAIALQDKITVVDLKTLTVIGEIAGMSTPDGMAWTKN